MNFTTYTDFRTAVLKMIDGDNVNSQALQQTTLDLLIALGEQAVYYGSAGGRGEPVPPLRVGEMESPLSITVAGNLAPLPADCLALKRVQLAGEYPMDYVAEEGALRLLKVGGSGSARKYTKQGTSLLFFPSLADATTVTGRYYKKFADISGGTLNAAFTRYPDVWLYAALAESAPFIGEDGRLPMWKTLYAGRVRAALANENERTSNGSRLTQVAR